MVSDSFEEALVMAVNLGGDADTVGACCGALAGACWGMDAIPKRWIRDLAGYPGIMSAACELALAAED
jgi:ADP-ribosyl-[dinitrogen reductase] hydrolase